MSLNRRRRKKGKVMDGQGLFMTACIVAVACVHHSVKLTDVLACVRVNEYVFVCVHM